jgi:hypothetical protein
VARNDIDTEESKQNKKRETTRKTRDNWTKGSNLSGALSSLLVDTLSST